MFSRVLGRLLEYGEHRRFFSGPRRCLLWRRYARGAAFGPMASLKGVQTRYTRVAIDTIAKAPTTAAVAIPSLARSARSRRMVSMRSSARLGSSKVEYALTCHGAGAVDADAKSNCVSPKPVGRSSAGSASYPKT
jgi:hypothetical protein